MSEHRMETPRKRGRKIAAIAAAVVVIPVAAWAAFMLLLGFNGSISMGKAEAGFSSGDTQVVGKESTECTTDGTTRITLTNTLPGGSCTISAGVRETSSNTIPLVVQSVEFAPDSEHVTTAFTGNPECGRPVSLSTAVKFKIAVSESAPMSTNIPAGSEAGITLVPVGDYDPNKCMVWSDGKAVPAA